MSDPGGTMKTPGREEVANGGARRGGPPSARAARDGGSPEEGRDRAGGARVGEEAAQREADYPADEPAGSEPVGTSRQFRSPLFFAQQAARYERQELIRQYEALFGCRLAVMIDAIFDESVTYFEELVFDADPAQDMHLMLASPGGYGEAAVRIVRAAQARCGRLTVVVPEIAKSAATILALGAHRILMGPASDLGPVDPQFPMPDGSLVSAKDMVAAVDRALNDIAKRPDTYPLHSGLLADVNALIVQQARSAIDRTADLVEEALRSNPDRKPATVEKLVEKLSAPLIHGPKSHEAIFGYPEAKKAGLPVERCDPTSEQWQRIWLLWTRYYTLSPIPYGPTRIYEGAFASQIFQGR